MAGNTMTLEFAGDADKLQRAAKQATIATDSVAKAADDAGKHMDDAAGDARRFESSMGDLGSATTGMIDAIGSLGDGVQAVADIQDYARDQAAKLARANVDVMQAQEDLNQAYRDGKQAAIDSDQAALDLTQARLDEKTALDAYNDAVAKFGANSAEAAQAQIDLKQAGIDVKQAQEDSAQATRDAAQANIDAKTAQVDLNDAMHEANPPDIQKWADKIGMVTPLLTALVGVTSLVTAAQWAWNAAQAASPLTWLVLAIGAVVAIIVVIATKTDWFQRLWRSAWGGIKAAARAVGSWFSESLWPSLRRTYDRIRDKATSVWDNLRAVPGKLKSSFAKVASYLFAPFRSAFNRVSDAWNNTVGRLSWTIPGWVPGVGGNTISAPNLPRYHTGGKLPGIPGQEVPFIGLAGEEVVPAGRSGGGAMHVTVQLGWDVLIEGLAREVRRRGGDVQFVLGGANA